jgi:hypothetical protein
MRSLALAVPILITLVGCPQKPPDRGTPTQDAASTTTVAPTPGVPATPDAAATAAPAASPTNAAPDDPMPDPITHPCVVTSAQFDIAFQDGDKTCQSDADCECIPLRVGSRHGCSGVTSKKAMAKLRALAKEFAKMKCSDTHKCAKQTCQPRCVSGQCQ